MSKNLSAGRPQPALALLGLAAAASLLLAGCAALAVAGTDGLVSRAFEFDAGSGSGLASPPPSATAAPPPSASARPQPTASEPPPQDPVDKTVKVTVYNAGQVKGAGGAAADQLTAAGFTDSTVDYPPNPADPTASTVYYSTAAQAATADLVAALLQIALVELDPLVAADGIVVVLK